MCNKLGATVKVAPTYIEQRMCVCKRNFVGLHLLIEIVNSPT